MKFGDVRIGQLKSRGGEWPDLLDRAFDATEQRGRSILVSEE